MHSLPSLILMDFFTYGMHNFSLPSKMYESAYLLISLLMLYVIEFWVFINLIIGKYRLIVLLIRISVILSMSRFSHI